MPVVVVTDSAARLPRNLLRDLGIHVVPLHILLGGSDLCDGIDDLPADLYQREAGTAGAAPAELAAAYRAALADSAGAGVAAIHLSSELSSTLSSAKHAAREFGERVVVVDSRSAAMGSGFVVLAAARAAAAGSDLEDVVSQAYSAVDRVHAFIVVQRLDNLRRSGRIGTAASWLGTALAIKPLLRIDAGKLVLGQRVRTTSRATAVMVENVLDVVGEGRAEIAVQHVDNPGAAAEVAATLGSALPACGPVTVTELGPVLGVHLGPGAVGVVVCVAE